MASGDREETELVFKCMAESQRLMQRAFGSPCIKRDPLIMSKDNGRHRVAALQADKRMQCLAAGMYLCSPGELQQSVICFRSRGRRSGLLFTDSSKGLKESGRTDGGVCIEHLPL